MPKDVVVPSSWGQRSLDKATKNMCPTEFTEGAKKLGLQVFINVAPFSMRAEWMEETHPYVPVDWYLSPLGTKSQEAKSVDEACLGNSSRASTSRKCLRRWAGLQASVMGQRYLLRGAHAKLAREL